jgi:hypothetical protein
MSHALITLGIMGTVPKNLIMEIILVNSAFKPNYGNYLGNCASNLIMEILMAIMYFDLIIQLPEISPSPILLTRLDYYVQKIRPHCLQDAQNWKSYQFLRVRVS